MISCNAIWGRAEVDAAQLHTLFAEIGPLFDLDQVSEFDGEASWAVVADGTVVTFEADDERSMLVLSAEVGRPRDDLRLKVYEAVLQYNLASRETGGARMALDGPDGAVVLLYDLATGDLETPRLAAVIEEFVAVVRGWRDLLARAPTIASGQEGGFDPAFLTGAIRA